MGRYLLGVCVLFVAGFATAAEPELHVVALERPSFDEVTRSEFGARVKVDRPGKEVVLLVSGYEAIAWEITATPQTKLTKVIFGGYKRQIWKVPFGADAEDMSAEGVKQRILPLSISAPRDIDAAGFRQFTRSVRAYTGLEIASFQSARRFDHKKPFVVDAVQNDDRLSSDFPKLTPAAQVPKFEFEATRVTSGKDPRDVRRTFGKFTQTGPAADGFVRLPDGITRLTFDTNAKRYYGIDTHLFYAVDLKLGTAKKIGTPADNFFPCALTYDAKRDRVLVTDGYSVCEYDTKNGKWAHLAGGDRQSIYTAIVWQAKTDMLLAFGVEDAQKGDAPVPTLFELNPNGAVALKNSLGSPLFPGILGAYRRGDAQLIDLGSKLALLVSCDYRDRETGERNKTEAFLYVIDPKSGKVQLAWKE